MKDETIPIWLKVTLTTEGDAFHPSIGLQELCMSAPDSGAPENKHQVPIWEKFALTINEAIQYFNIGEKKIRKFVDNQEDYDFVMMNGTKALIKRKKFEDFLNDTSSF